ncbi:MAG: amidohydrolase family protein [Candidatus Thermoplasmatota archaeon]
MPLVAGKLLYDDDVREGWIEVADGKVVDLGDGKPPAKPDATGWVVPAPVNAHTHVADACLRSRPNKPTTVPELVGPGGWKQRELASAAHDQLRQGVIQYVDEMAAIGTARFLDFRETGLAGVTFLRSLSQDLAVQPFIMGRPTGFTFHDTEAIGLMREVDGIGLSALRDFPRREDAEAWAEAAHKAGKPLALHASEAKHEDIEDVLALEPEFLVHCTQATDDDFDAIGDEGATVVVCPRSNAHYGMKTPLDRMREAGVTVAVGTDNGMLNDGNLLAELGQLHDWFPAVPVEQLLRMATIHGRALVGLRGLPSRKGAAVDLVVLPDQPWGKRASGRPGFTVPA